MSLRNRLLLAAVGLLSALALAFTGVALAQRSYVLGQLDERLVALSSNTKALVALSNRVQAGNEIGAEILADVYVGVQRANGRLVTVLAPTDDPALRPRLLGGEEGRGPVTRAAEAGSAQRVRLVSAPLVDGRNAIIAVSMAPVEAAARRLAFSLGLAWLGLVAVAAMAGGWLYRLGLRPIARVTAAAEAITAGSVPQRLDEGHPGTEAGRLTQAFNTMVTATLTGQERLKQFVADASHELRTPLTTLRGYTSLYAQGALATQEQVDDAMRRIGAEAGRMSRMVDDLLDLTALDSAGPLPMGRLDLGSVLADAATDLNAVDPERAVRLEADQDLIATADEDRIRQALGVLTANARRYSPPDAPIQLRGRHVNGRVRVEVADQGRGIPPEALPRIFDRFFRVDSREPRGSRGSGLGLAIVAAIVTAHQGRYGVTSIPGRGSTFWFELPAS